MKTHTLPTNRQGLRALAGGLALAALVCGPSASATPYASGISNNAGTVYFYLNEGGGNVTITFEDSSTDPVFNGAVQAAGRYSFALGAHTSYSIKVAKTGSGQPSLIGDSLGLATPRGVAVNSRAGSPYFGRIYAANCSGPNGIYAFNSDWSVAVTNANAGISFNSGNAYDPYRISVAEDDYLMVGDASFTGGAAGAAQNDGVWRVTPNLAGSQLFLGPKGKDDGINYGVHATIGSRPWVIGNVQSGNPVTLLTVDMDYPSAHGANSLLVYNNITLASLPWQVGPDIHGPEVGLNLASTTLGGNSFPGLQAHGNYIYCSTFRGNYSNPNLQIYTNDIGNGDSLALVWDSITARGGSIGTGPDFYSNVTDANGNNSDNTVDIGVSPDGNYVACLIRRNWFVITPLTNGLPDVSRIFKSAAPDGTTIARAMAWDAANNLYLSSSGLGRCQSWSLGMTTIATTTGNASGSTGFTLSVPTAHVSVVAATPDASQGGVNGSPGTPVPGVFTITRNDPSGYASPLTVNFSLSGTATADAYAASAGTPAVGGIVTIPANATSVDVTITPSTADVPRRTTTAVLTVTGGGYVVDQPSQATVRIQNTSHNQLVVTPAAPTMYKAFANDFASITITRLGDTNVAAYTTAPYTYAGAATPNVDFTPLPAVTFNPGDLVQVPVISPLSNGVPPANVANPAYSGNKSVIVTLPASGDYASVAPSNSTTLTLIDNAQLPNPVLFSDALTDPADAANWAVTYASGNLTQEPSDYDVEFGYDLTSGGPGGYYGIIPPPPSGATTALRITCNKQQPGGATYGGGVNLYYTNKVFSGNYAVRFNMNLVSGSGSFIIEGPLFGINHNGQQTNWWLAGTANYEAHNWASDGIWYWIQTPPGGYGGFAYNEFQSYTGLGGGLPNTGWLNLANAGAMPNVFKHAVFTAPGGTSGGTPANNSPVSATPADEAWADVEVKQINNIVTMSVNKTPIFSYVNTTTFKSGYLMLGYNCPLGGAFNNYLGTPDAAVYISNLRVVSLSAPVIDGITDTVNEGNHNVTISFSSVDGSDSPATYALQSAGVVGGPYTDVAGASIVQVFAGDPARAHFQAATSSSGTAQFYRVRRR